MREGRSFFAVWANIEGDSFIDEGAVTTGRRF
jgi:hypothetical protein